MALKKLITIWGSSFCGSTVMQCVLGSLPGVATSGEDHVLSDLEQFPDAGCTAHRQACPVVTPEFVASVKVETLYEQLADIFGVDTLVTADKIPALYKRLLPYGDRNVMAIVLFRHPAAYAYSCKKREGRPTHISGSARSRATAWSRRYEDALEYLELEEIPYIVVDYVRFMSRPGKSLRSLCKWLDVPFDRGALSWWKTDHHYLGGNDGVSFQLSGRGSVAGKRYRKNFATEDTQFVRDNFRSLTPDESWKTALPEEEIQEVLGMKEVMDLYAKLKDLSAV